MFLLSRTHVINFTSQRTTLIYAHSCTYFPSTTFSFDFIVGVVCCFLIFLFLLLNKIVLMFTFFRLLFVYLWLHVLFSVFLLLLLLHFILFTLPIILPILVLPAIVTTLFLHFLHNIHNASLFLVSAFRFTYFYISLDLLLICVLWAPGLQFV